MEVSHLVTLCTVCLPLRFCEKLFCLALLVTFFGLNFARDSLCHKLDINVKWLLALMQFVLLFSASVKIFRDFLQMYVIQEHLA